MKNNVNIKYMIYMILTILGILALTRLYVYYTVDDIDEVKPVGKIEEVQDVENVDEIEVEDILELNTTKEENNTKVNAKVVKTKVDTEKVVYGSDLGDGYNMELNVPEKWSHLDYSHLGNPKEVALKPEEYLPGDKLYSKDDPRYYNEGKFYFGAKAEKALLDMFQDREALDIYLDLVRNSPVDMITPERAGKEDNEDLISDIEDFFSDINNFIKIDEKTGRKEIAIKTEYTTKTPMDSVKWMFCEEGISRICPTKDSYKEYVGSLRYPDKANEEKKRYSKAIKRMNELGVSEDDYNKIVEYYHANSFVKEGLNINYEAILKDAGTNISKRISERKKEYNDCLEDYECLFDMEKKLEKLNIKKEDINDSMFIDISTDNSSDEVMSLKKSRQYYMLQEYSDKLNK